MFMKHFCGGTRPAPYFEGWYLKHQSRNGQALALIPAFHIDSSGCRSASLQVITNSGSWWLEYPQAQFQASPNRFQVRVGQSWFGCHGIKLNVDQNGLLLQGTLNYGPFTAIRSDIMGPFRLFAHMQCSHGVISMRHSLEGALNINGEIIDFSGGAGYIETDRGHSFPNAYLWTQCAGNESENSSLMLAIATVPLPVGGFTGCICAIIHQGREYRLASYRGARIEKWSPAGASIRQGNYRLTVDLIEGHGQSLRAPEKGNMERTVSESLCAVVNYCLWKGKEVLFQHTDQYAGFEYSNQ